MFTDGLDRKRDWVNCDWDCLIDESGGCVLALGVGLFSSFIIFFLAGVSGLAAMIEEEISSQISSPGIPYPLFWTQQKLSKARVNSRKERARGQ